MDDLGVAPNSNVRKPPHRSWKTPCDVVQVPAADTGSPHPPGPPGPADILSRALVMHCQISHLPAMWRGDGGDGGDVAVI